MEEHNTIRVGKHEVKVAVVDYRRFFQRQFRFDKTQRDILIKDLNGGWIAFRRLIVNAKPGDFVMHMNGDKFDHRPNNLFVANRSEVRKKLIATGQINIRAGLSKRYGADRPVSPLNDASVRRANGDTRTKEDIKESVRDLGHAPRPNMASDIKFLSLPDYILPLSSIAMIDISRWPSAGEVDIVTNIPDAPWSTATFAYRAQEAKQIMANLQSLGMVAENVPVSNTVEVEQLKTKLEELDQTCLELTYKYNVASGRASSAETKCQTLQKELDDIRNDIRSKLMGILG